MPHKIQYQNRRLLGLCTQCSNKSINGKSRCEVCNIKYLKRDKDRKSRLSKNNLCFRCGLKKEQENKTLCNYCLDKGKFYAANIRKEWESKNLCVDCGNKTNSVDYKRCPVCYLKMISINVFGTNKKYVELLNLFEKQNCKCAYTDKDLILQENCELDHIIPKSRNGSNSIDNLQWLHRDVNKMKHDLTEKEFMTTIREIIELKSISHNQLL